VHPDLMVDGSCAKHLTVQSYTVVMLLTFILIIILNLPFLQVLPSVAFLFFFRTEYMVSLDCLLILLSISIFNFFLVSSFLYLLVPCSRLS